MWNDQLAAQFQGASTASMPPVPPARPPARTEAPSVESSPGAALRAIAESLVTRGAGGRRVFQLLVPGGCRHSCAGCPMRGQRSMPEETQTADRLARLFLMSYRLGRCDGAFLTAGLAAVPVWAAERLIALVETLRLRHGFQGYLHVKVPEGATASQVQRLLHLVDRISYNPEPACEVAALAVAGGAAGAAGASSGSLASAGTTAGPSFGGLGTGGEAFPVELTTADGARLRAVPGIGRRRADRLLASRAGRTAACAPVAIPRGARGLVTCEGRLVGLSKQPSLFDELDLRSAGTRIASRRG